MASDITDEDIKNPWSMLFVTAACLGVAVYIFSSFIFETREKVPQRDSLQQSKGSLIDIKLNWDDELSFRLSDSERWYRPVASRTESYQLYGALRAAPPGTQILVLYGQRRNWLLTGGGWHFAAYTVSIGNRQAHTFQQSTAAIEDHDSTEFWLAVFLGVMGLVFAQWTYSAYLGRKAFKSQTD
jgi:hypothetical protein